MRDMTETLSHNGFKLSEVTTLKEENLTVTEFEADHAFDLLMSDIDGYSPPELESTLQDKLQEISMLNDVALEETSVTPIQGIEATDVCSLFKQFMEYEASDEALSYPDSINSVMSPAASPGEQDGDVVLDTLISVQEKLTREVVIDVETNVVDGVCNDNLVMNIPNEDKIIRTVNGVHPKTNLLRMADSPKFAKFKKKRLTNEPPLRIASSLPNTPRCTSPSDMVSSEERKHMEIKLIEALALPVPKNTPKQNGKHSKDKINKKRSLGGCPTKRKHPPVEPIPSRLMAVISKRFKNNLDQSKGIKDPRLKELGGNVDPRLSKADYGTKCNVTQFKNTNLNELNSSTNTATETVDDVCIIDMTIEHEKDDVGTINMTINHENQDCVIVTDMTIVHDNDDDIIDTTSSHDIVSVNNTTVNCENGDVGNIHNNNNNNITIDQESLSKTNILETNNTIITNGNTELEVVTITDEDDSFETAVNDEIGALEIVLNDNGMCEAIVNGVGTHEVVVNGGCTTETVVNGNVICDTVVDGSNGLYETAVNGYGTCETVVNGYGTCPAVVGVDDICEILDDNSELKIVEFPSLTAIEIKTEELESNEATNNSCTNRVVNSNGVIKPKKNYRKGRSKTPNAINGTCSSGSEDENDEDDRAYNRKKSKKSKNSRTLSHIKTEKSPSKTPSSNNSKSRHSSSPSRIRSVVCRRKRSKSPVTPTMRSDYSNDRYEESEGESDFSYSDRSDRSDCENMDISNKLIELSNPVPYDIEHERKLRFIRGGASKGMGERRNIYAGGITEDTTKAELADRFRRFGKISKITLHFREKGDNYAFIVFEEPDNAMRAIEEGNDDPNFPHLDLCFGGRRRFVGGSYVDFDGNNRYLEESDKGTVNNRSEAGEDDFDRLLQRAMNESKTKRETSPEWP